MDYDYIVIGSGFGGSVSALRLAEKGYRVAVLEQGRRVTPDDMSERPAASAILAAGTGMKGFFPQSMFRHVGVVGGVGVGGGSLVYAAVLLEPGPAFFGEPTWSGLGIDWQAELASHYETAKRMLGRTRTRRAMGRWITGCAPPPSRWAPAKPSDASAGDLLWGDRCAGPDPFFAGRGPARARLPFLRRVPDGLPLRLKKQPGSELPPPGRVDGCDDPARAPGDRHPAAGRRRLSC